MPTDTPPPDTNRDEPDGWKTAAIKPRRPWLIIAVCLAVVSLLAWIGLRNLEQSLTVQLDNRLSNTLQANCRVLTAWLDAERTKLGLTCQQPTIRKHLIRLIKDAHTNNPESVEARKSSNPAIPHEPVRPMLPGTAALNLLTILSDRTGRIIACDGQDLLAPIPTETYWPASAIHEFEKTLHGNAVVVRPQLADLSRLVNQSDAVSARPSIIVATPIQDGDQIIGSLSLFLDASSQFSTLQTVALNDPHSRTYTIDVSGRELSTDNSHPHSCCIPNAQLHIERARQSGAHHVSLPTYTNLLDVPVVGALQWIDEYELGVVTELDESQAFALRNQVRLGLAAIMACFFFAAAGIVLLPVMMPHFPRRKKHAIERPKRIGQFELIEQIGAGGKGKVYRARHATLNHHVAIKLLHPSRNAALLTARFLMETRALNQFRNPHIVRILDCGQTGDGCHYYAMELLNGANFQQLVHQYGPLPDRRVKRILQQICDALREVHQAGFVHCDIKPSNIMLHLDSDNQEIVKVLDFGLIRHTPCGEPKRLDPKSEATIISGTPAYMSPESSRSPEWINCQSDIYSLGCVSYFLLTGKPPFTGSNPIETCWKHSRETPIEVTELTPHPIASELARLTMQCLAKKPEERPESVHSILQRLERITPLSP